VVLPEVNFPQGGAANWSNGFLSAHFQGTALRAEGSPILDLRPPPGVTTDDQRRNLELLADLNRGDAARHPGHKDPIARTASYELAFRMQAEVPGVLDLSREDPRTLREYGIGTEATDSFGRRCLLARRLIEAGVRFVTINTFLTVFDEITWDIHGSKPFTSIQGMKEIVAPMYDQGYSALIEDLSQRGLLPSTMVCNLAEFGRTPRLNPAGGRDHWPQCWTVYFAGGGVKGGRVVGRSDPIGAYPAERPVTPSEIVATIYSGLGVDLEQHLPGPASRPYPVVDFGTHAIQELFQA